MLSVSDPSICVVAGNSNPDLAMRVARELNVDLTNCHVGSRSCGEVQLAVPESIRGRDVYIVQPTCGRGSVELNHTVLELLFLIRALKETGADRITAVIPFFAYARQDRKTDLRCPISASAISQLIDKMGVDRVVTLDLHAGQIQGYFNNRAPLDNLNMAHEFAQYIRSSRWFNKKECVIVSPDAGGVARAHHFADLLGVSHIVTVMKRRARAGVVSEMHTVGDVKDYTCIIIDDMIDTGGTLVKACDLLKSLGATKVVACITHGILTDPCVARVNASTSLEELVISDSIPQQTHADACDKLTVLGIAPLLAQAMATYHSGGSISELFNRPATPAPTPQSQSMRRDGTSPTSSGAPGTLPSGDESPKAALPPGVLGQIKSASGSPPPPATSGASMPGSNTASPSVGRPSSFVDPVRSTSDSSPAQSPPTL